MGWRYLFYTSGSVVFLMSIARVLIIRFHETPKYLLCQGKDEIVVRQLKSMAEKYNRRCDLTVEQLEECGQVTSAHANQTTSISELWVHVRGLFATKRLGFSTALVWFSWALIGLGYSLYYVYLPDYLASRAEKAGDSSAYITWRNYAITNLLSIPGPIIASFMCETRLGRKYTMAIGAIVTSKFPIDSPLHKNGASANMYRQWRSSLPTPQCGLTHRTSASVVQFQSLSTSIMAHCMPTRWRSCLLHTVALVMVLPFHSTA